MIRPVRRMLLIYPPDRALKGFFRANVPPLGPMSLAAYVRDMADVSVLDAKCEGYENVWRSGPFEVYGITMDQVEERIREYGPDAVGITCLASFNWPEVMETAVRAKAVDPDIVTVAGGTHPTFLSEQCLAQCKDLDLVVRGEGEQTLVRIIEASRKEEGLENIPGLAYREDGGVRCTPPAEPIADLDPLPFPARDLVPMEKYFHASAPFSRIYKRKRNTSIQTSRGCPAHCTFCSSARFWGHGFRGQSPDRVLSEMEHLKESYGVRELQFIDDNLIFDRERASAIFKGMMERGLELDWCMPNGIALWRLDNDLLGLMRDAGCYSVTLAIESGNQRVLSRVIKKPLNLEKVRPLVAEMKRLSIQVHAFFISGFPGETKEEMKDTYRLARDLDLDGAYFFIASPLPGTELYEKGIEQGHLPPALDFTSIDFNKGHFNTGEWTAEQVERLTGVFYLGFMFSALLRHPLRFIKNYGGVIFKRPFYVAAHFFEFIARWGRELFAGRGHASG